MSDDVERTKDALEDAYEAATGHLAGLPTLEILDAVAPGVLAAIRAATHEGMARGFPGGIASVQRSALDAALAALTDPPGGTDR